MFFQKLNENFLVFEQIVFFKELLKLHSTSPEEHFDKKNLKNINLFFSGL